MAVKKDLKKTAIMQFGADGTKTAEGTKKGVTNATTDYPLVSPTPTDLLNYYKNTGTNVPKTAPATTPVVSTPVATTPVVTTQAATTPVATTPAATTPAATQTTTPAASTTQTTAKTQAAEVKPFTYGDFSYDKQFTYDDFSYDKQFAYDDFSYGNFSYGNYTESDAVKQANALLQQQIANKPGAYQSQWQDEISDYMNQISNRDPFSYNYNEDAMYNQLKDNYIQQGQLAMMDTMGQAAAMTGGYGNSYAQTVGQQAYNQQLNQLNNVIPELYQMAYDRYSDEGKRLQEMLGMYQGLEDQEYGRYMDNYNAWQSERDYLANRYDTERANDYSRWETDRALAYDQYTADRNLAYDEWSSGRDLAYDQYTADRNLAYDKWSSDRDLAYDEYQNALNMAYQQERDAISDAQWQAEFDENKRRYEEGKNSGGNGNPVVKDPVYKDMDLDKVRTNYGRFDSIEAIEAYGDQLVSEGYNPDTVYSLEQEAKQRLNGLQEPEMPPIENTGYPLIAPTPMEMLNYYKFIGR